MAAIATSLHEQALGVLVGPFQAGQDLGIGRVCLVLRRGIWEPHGGAVEPSCRVIDDLLFAERRQPKLSPSQKFARAAVCPNRGLTDN